MIYLNIFQREMKMRNINSTFLVNGTRKEYVNLGFDFPDKLGQTLFLLEQRVGWDLRHDNIYVWYTLRVYDYKDVKGYIIG